MRTRFRFILQHLSWVLATLSAPALGQSYHPGQLPIAGSASSGSWFIVFKDDILQLFDAGSVAPSSSGTLTNQTYHNPTFTGSISSSADPIFTSASPGRIGLHGTPGWSVDIFANAITFGANDGPYTNRVRTASTAKDLGFRMVDYGNNPFGFMRAQGSAANNTLTLGYNAGGERGATRMLFTLAASTSATSGTAVGEITAGGMVLGSVARNSAAIFQLDSNARGFLPPRMTSAEFAAIASKPAGLFAWDTSSSKITYFDGSSIKTVPDITSVFSSSDPPRVGLNGNPAWSVDIFANAVTFGANDGPYTNTLRTASTSKDLGFRMVDYGNNLFGFMRAQGSAANNTLTLGYNAGGERGATRMLFTLAANTSSTSGTAVGEMTAGGLVLGATSRDPAAILELVSTARGFLPPRMTDAEFEAIASKPAGLIAFGNTSARPVFYDGSTSRVVADVASVNPSTVSVTLAGGSLTISGGGGRRNYSHVCAVTNDFALIFSGVADGDSGRIRLLPDSVSRTITLGSPAFSPTGSTITVPSSGNVMTNHFVLEWSVWRNDGTNRIDVSGTALSR